MAVSSSEILIEWTGGLNTSVDPAFIGESQVAESHNAIMADGTVRLDPRYILKAELVAADRVTAGATYVRYGTGTQSELYVVAISGQLYHIDLNSLPFTFVPIINAQTLAGGAWVFEQHANYVYAGNEIQGLGRRVIGPGTNGTGDWTWLQKPTAPVAGPVCPAYTPAFITGSWTGCTLSTTGGGVTATLTGNTILISTTSAGSKTVTITFDTSPDLRIDAQYRDIMLIAITPSNTQMQVPELSFLEGSDEYQFMFWRNHTNPFNYYHRLHNTARGNRNQITAIKLTFTAIAGSNTYRVFEPQFYGVWLSLPTTYNPGSSLPVLQPLKYAYTYWNQTTGFESSPSPTSAINAQSQNPLGEWRNITMASTAQSGVSHIRLYRVIGDAGNETYYRLSELANSGTPTYLDKLPVDEVEALPQTVPTIVPASGITAMQAFLGRLAVLAGGILYVSRSDNPIGFESLSGAVDEFDEGRGLTIYIDDRRAETGMGLVENDALYVITDRSIRCLFGTTPSNWRYVKLPISEGACGRRAYCSYLGGMLVLTPSGRLLYCEIGQTEPIDLAVQIKPRYSNEGLRALATEEAVLAVSPDGEIEVRSESGDYAIRSVSGEWRMGTHTHPTHTMLFVSGVAPRFFGRNGKLYEGGSDDYVTDGGTTGTNGIEVFGHYSTRDWRLPRIALKNIFWGATTESLGPADTLLYPKVDIITSRGVRTVLKTKGKTTTRLSHVDSGESIQFKVYFDRHTNVTEMRVRFDPLSEAPHQ